MNINNLDLNLLKVFDALFRERNLTRASVKLCLSQSAVSNALSRLRIALDDPLFQRSSQGMSPTPRAKQLMAPIQQALDLIQNSLRENTPFDYGTSSRTFVIGVGDYGEAVILPRLTDWIMKVAPHIRIDIRAEHGSQIREEVKEGRIDFALDYFKIPDDKFTSRHLMNDSLVSLVRRDHPSVGEHLSLSDYLTLPHVVMTQRNAWIDMALKKEGMKRNIAMRVPHFLSMPLIVQKTDLICTLPKRMAHVYADSFRVRVLKTPLVLQPFPIYSIWHESMENDPGHRWLREAFYDLCQRL
ncbi:LysR family transcriptional regulator [Paralcaligenes ureilyticus]|uniref:LysR family transcriptional regulator n=1 Tax=Paralcaligenes ureilyticus TaxID=627131 RepID=A0A4R3M7G1_9BURK|nr:LysR family transcriptional regulator [Paralcaligenes ureilyticus]TCT08976.1 LysR family transcriptional regulator [Paralcaligenes ureilyticus]